MRFKEKLKKLRGKAGMTQESLSDKSGIPLGTLQSYEHGRRIPGFGVIIRLATALGHDCRVFADCDDIAEEPPPAKKWGKK